MAGVWFTSDLHINHKGVSELRGFDDRSEHDEAICENWIKVVRPEDTVWVLGDISIGGKGNEEYALEVISKLPGTKKIIFGNHDGPGAVHSKPEKYFKAYMDVFDFGKDYVKKKIDGKIVEFSHFPFTRDHSSIPRYPEHRRPDYGQWLVHGHTHDDIVKQGKQIHVGLDAHGLNLVSQEQVLEYMDDPATFIVRSPSTGELRKVYA